VAGAVFSAAKEHAEETRKMAQSFARFSPAMTQANAQNRVQSLLQDIELAQKYGDKYARQEREIGRIDREKKAYRVENEHELLAAQKRLELFWDKLSTGFLLKLDGLLQQFAPAGERGARGALKRAQDWFDRWKQAGMPGMPGLNDLPPNFFVRGGWNWGAARPRVPAGRQFIRPGPFDKPIAGMKQA
jgi:hypothetical protein